MGIDEGSGGPGDAATAGVGGDPVIFVRGGELAGADALEAFDVGGHVFFGDQALPGVLADELGGGVAGDDFAGAVELDDAAGGIEYDDQRAHCI